MTNESPLSKSPLTAFSSALAEARTSRKLTYRRLAFLSGINIATLHSLEHRGAVPTYNNILKLTSILKNPRLVELAEDLVVWWWRNKDVDKLDTGSRQQTESRQQPRSIL